MASGRSNARIKPAKPHADFPLFAHNNGQWSKKIRGKLHYFGGWDDPTTALDLWLDQKDDLLAGRTPRAKADDLTLAAACNQFLTDRRHRVDAGELTERSWHDYHQSCERLIQEFGKTRPLVDLGPDDFLALRESFAKKWGPNTIGNEIQRTRTLFKYVYESGLIASPIKFGPTFKRPSQRNLRLHRKKKGKQLFNAEQIRRLLDGASIPMKAMILLGINLGFGNRDCAYLPMDALDLKNGWYDHFRVKTAVGRRGKLWSETVDAVQLVLQRRRKPTDSAYDELVFITSLGNPWVQVKSNSVTLMFSRLMKAEGITKPGMGFYTLRHTFRTVADNIKDAPAIRLIMGHVDDSIDGVYREEISDDRLLAVTNHVHGWLFGNK